MSTKSNAEIAVERVIAQNLALWNTTDVQENVAWCEAFVKRVEEMERALAREYEKTHEHTLDRE